MNSDKFDFFIDLSKKTGEEFLSYSFAKCLDDNDELRLLRNKFSIPKTKDNKDIVYMNGNSLGLMPKVVRRAVIDQLDKWETRGSLGHVEDPGPWITCDEEMLDELAELVGSNKNEVAIMGQLTVNLHLMLVAFYKPTNIRYKILCESSVFPSDNYVFESQTKWHGFDPVDAIIRISPRENETKIRNEDIITLINNQGHEIALICFSGVQFFTGQYFNINKITEAGHNMGCAVGWDLAHAVGNVPLKLHDWNVDFAVWCSYKYLNCGAGSVGGIFVHEKNLNDESIGYFQGWWGHRLSDRFKMKNKFQAESGALKFRLSNPSFICCAVLKASVNIFKEVGIWNLRKKSIILTNYLEFLLIHGLDKEKLQIITPEEVSERGSQLTLKCSGDVITIHRYLDTMGVVCDVREPSTLRMAPCALYNTFTDVYLAADALKKFYSIN